jgi:DNA-binding response OmpR family regulator
VVSVAVADVDTLSAIEASACHSAARSRLLVVEDEWLISTHLSEYLQELGYDVVGPASTIAEAVFLSSRADIDAALVDLSLGGVLAIDVIDALAKRGIPFVFVTGFSAMPEGVHYDAPLVEKPFKSDDLVSAIESVLTRR